MPGTNNQLPAGQVHLDNPKGLLNQDVHNSSYYAGFPLTFSILTKGTQTKSLRLSALLPLPPIAQWVTRSCQLCLLNISNKIHHQISLYGQNEFSKIQFWCHSPIKISRLLSPQDKIQTPQLNIQNILHKPVSSSKSPSATSHHSLDDVTYLFILSTKLRAILGL